MICETQLKQLCSRYNITYKFFPATNILVLDSGLDEWQIRYVGDRRKPYCLLHKNKLNQNNRYHIQRWLRTLYQAVHSIASHKGVLTKLYGLQNTY